MDSAFKRTLRFVLEQAEQQPLRRRIEIYRDISVICGDERDAVELKAAAERLHEAALHLEQVQLTLFGPETPEGFDK